MWQPLTAFGVTPGLRPRGLQQLRRIRPDARVEPGDTIPHLEVNGTWELSDTDRLGGPETFWRFPQALLCQQAVEEEHVSLLVPYQESWPQRFQQAAEELGQVIGLTVVEIHHIGSTAVDTVPWSKPVIDILVEVRDLTHLEGVRAERLAEAGFEERGEYGIAGRRYFVRAAGKNRLKTHVHCYEQGDVQIDRHLNFRDYLRRHPAEAAAYSSLKWRLASAHGRDKASFQAGKAEFIARVEELARDQRQRRGP